MANPTADSTVLLARLLAAQPRKKVLRQLTERGVDLLLSPEKDFLEGIGSLPVGKQPQVAKDIRTIGWFDDAFPAALKAIPDPPLLLYVQGELDGLTNPLVAVVGARRCTTQGRETARSIAAALSLAGISVVSGLAWGIDGAAHRGAVDENRPTIAVLGAGFDHLYPSGHRGLAQQIIARRGALISEYAPGVSVRRHQFVERNRIISGLSVATVVVEAGVKSGSLITADFALEQGRDVMAVPGWISNPASAGCHKLIKEGASLVTGAPDILEAMGIESSPLTESNTAKAEMSQRERTCYEFLVDKWKTVDEIMSHLDASLPEVNRLLIDMELSGFVQQGPLGYIARS